MYSWQRFPSHSAGILFTLLVVSFSGKKILMIFYLRETVEEGTIERRRVRHGCHEVETKITLLGVERESDKYIERRWSDEY